MPETEKMTKMMMRVDVSTHEQLKAQTSSSNQSEKFKGTVGREAGSCTQMEHPQSQPLAAPHTLLTGFEQEDLDKRRHVGHFYYCHPCPR